MSPLHLAIVTLQDCLVQKMSSARWAVSQVAELLSSSRTSGSSYYRSRGTTCSCSYGKMKKLFGPRRCGCRKTVAVHTLASKCGPGTKQKPRGSKVKTRKQNFHSNVVRQRGFPCFQGVQWICLMVAIVEAFTAYYITLVVPSRGEGRELQQT